MPMWVGTLPGDSQKSEQKSRVCACQPVSQSQEFGRGGVCELIRAGAQGCQPGSAAETRGLWASGQEACVCKGHSPFPCA